MIAGLQVAHGLLAAAELDGSLQTSDGLAIHADNVGTDGVGSLSNTVSTYKQLHLYPRNNNTEGSTGGGMTYRRHLLGNLDCFRDGKDALLDGALKVDVGNLFAEIGPGVDKADQAVLDDEVDVGSVFDRLEDGSSCPNDQVSAPAYIYAISQSVIFKSSPSLFVITTHQVRG